MDNKLSCFKAYDIRGKIGSEISHEVFYRIARAYGEFLKPRQVVVGADVRLTSELLKGAVIEGLRDAGVDVLDLGLAGTEEVYFAAFHLKLDGGVEITASHNPMDFNGMKLVGHCAAPISSETGLQEIQAIAEANQFATVNITHRGSYRQFSLLYEYTDHLMQYIDLAHWKRPLKVVINSGNGAAGHVIDSIEQRFLQANVPIQLIKVHHQADGHFPNGIPNPLLPENRQDTINAVLEHQADIGVAFDGDFDRCFFFDEKGHFIEGYYIVGLLAEAFLKQNPGSKIIYDPRLIWNTIDIVEQSGGEAIMSRTGHSFIKQLMRENDVIYGGEMSAHHYFRDFGYCDSGMIPWLLVLQLLSGKPETLGELVASRIVAYPSSGEINRQVVEPQKVIQAIYQVWHDKAKSIDYTDGMSMTFDDWRFNIRVSNTEALLRLNVESKQDIALMQRMTNKLLELIDAQ